MCKQAFLLLAFFITVTVHAWSQVQPAATGDMAPLEEDTRMMTPPIASGFIYPNLAGSEERSNYLAASVSAGAAYIDNVLPATTGKPITDYAISILPALTFNQTTPRQRKTFTYNPSFTFYKDTTALNAMDQSATGAYEGRLSPHFAVELQDTFVRTQNVFNTGYPFTAGGIAGSAQTPVPAVIVPFAEQLRNDANVDIAYQPSSRGMVGAGGFFSNYRFPNPSQAPGLYNSDGIGGTGFYNRRLNRAQYAGVLYEYNDVMAFLSDSKYESQIHAPLAFYTLSLRNRLSFSAAAGAQYLTSLHHGQPKLASWSPMAVLSFGYQANRGNIAASYLRSVVAGQGLAGAFTSNSTNFLAGLKITRTWNGSTSFSYQSTNSAAALLGLSYQAGNTLTASASLEHTMGERLSIHGEYDRLHEKYNGLAVISANPDSDRALVTVTYKLTKSLGR